MDQGVSDLEKWISDILALGLIHIPEQRDAIMRISERLVDTQLGSIAKRIRMALDLVEREPDWTQHWINLLGQLLQFISLFRQVETLPHLLAIDVWQYAGVFVKKKDVIARTPVRDQWLILGQETRPEEKLIVRKTWLFGIKNRQWATLIDFAMNSKALDPVPDTGKLWDAYLCYYPSQTGYRALVAHGEKITDWSGSAMGFDGWKAFYTYRYQRLLKNPLDEQFPCLIREVSFEIGKDDVQMLVDGNREVMAVNGGAISLDTWLAFSANGPMAVFGEIDGQQMNAWSIFTQGRWIAAN